MLFCLAYAPSAFASRPGGGDEGPDQCTVMGEVVSIQEDKGLATVRLKQISGSTTYNGCSATGAQGMAEKNTPVTVPLNIQPKPFITVGDVVFVNVRSDRDISLETFAPGDFTLDMLLKEVQIYFDDRLQRFKFIYAIKCYLGVQQTVEKLVPELVEADKEKRLSAALMLIVLAGAKHPVPPAELQLALRIGLMESRKSAVGSSITLYPGDRAQVVNVLIGMLHDKEVVDPFASIVAMGEMGEEGARALPDAIDRINDASASQLRSDGDRIFAEAVTKMKAEEKAVKIFMAKVDEGKLKDKEGPLAKGMCRLKVKSDELAAWCRNGGVDPQAACREAVGRLDSFIATLPNTCGRDDDCSGYYFPVGAPECPPAHMLSKSGMTPEKQEGALKFRAMVEHACATEWENKHAVCSPAEYKPGCRDGKCVNLQK
ncbi:MAG: hypothetical protein EPN97_18300 [Alphaproteobacteria bacterium]|nr:MAG: hypothetical protein EPN97_18300 [Alphaproteobacteria bacterium]